MPTVRAAGLLVMAVTFFAGPAWAAEGIPYAVDRGKGVDEAGAASQKLRANAEAVFDHRAGRGNVLPALAPEVFATRWHAAMPLGEGPVDADALARLAADLEAAGWPRALPAALALVARLEAQEAAGTLDTATLVWAEPLARRFAGDAPEVTRPLARMALRRGDVSAAVRLSVQTLRSALADRRWRGALATDLWMVLGLALIVAQLAMLLVAWPLGWQRFDVRLAIAFPYWGRAFRGACVLALAAWPFALGLPIWVGIPALALPLSAMEPHGGRRLQAGMFVLWALWLSAWPHALGRWQYEGSVAALAEHVLSDVDAGWEHERLQGVVPRDRWANYALGMASRWAGEHRDAKAFLSAATAAGDLGPGAHVALGNLAWREGEGEAALRQYAVGAANSAGDVTALVNASRVAFAIGKRAHGEASLRQANASDPEGAARLLSALHGAPPARVHAAAPSLGLARDPMASPGSVLGHHLRRWMGLLALFFAAALWCLRTPESGRCRVCSAWKDPTESPMYRAACKGCWMRDEATGVYRGALGGGLRLLLPWWVPWRHGRAGLGALTAGLQGLGVGALLLAAGILPSVSPWQGPQGLVFGALGLVGLLAASAAPVIARRRDG